MAFSFSSEAGREREGAKSDAPLPSRTERPFPRSPALPAYNRPVIYVVTILALMLGFDLLFWWRADRRLRPLRRGPVWRLVLGLFMAAQVVCLLWVFFGRMLGDGAEGSNYSSLVTATYLWHMLVLLPATLVWAAVDVLRLVAGWARRPGGPSDGEALHAKSVAAPVDPAGPTRREFLGAVAVAAPPLVTVVGTAVAGAQLDEFRVRHLNLLLPDLPRGLDGLTIAHVSDVHVGTFTNGRTLTRIVEATNNLRADLVLLTGDLINFNIADLPAGLDMVRRMDPRAGLFMCEGNHDLLAAPEAFVQTVRRSGVPILINESQTVRVRGRDVQILGLRWGSGRPGAPRSEDRSEAAIAASVRQLLPAVRPDAFPILLAHHPHAFGYAAEAGIPLTLAGHTHGGQLMLTESLGFGPAMYRYWSGPYAKDHGRRHLVVSNGVGNWFPLRVNAPAEIVSITLRA